MRSTSGESRRMQAIGRRPKDELSALRQSRSQKNAAMAIQRLGGHE